MKKYYVFDTTTTPPKYVIYGTTWEIVKYLESYVLRALKKTRAQFMYEMSELGHGYDDSDGVSFTRLLGEYVNIGVIQKGKPVKCDIHVVNKFSSEEYGH